MCASTDNNKMPAGPRTPLDQGNTGPVVGDLVRDDVPIVPIVAKAMGSDLQAISAQRSCQLRHMKTNIGNGSCHAALVV